MPQLSDVPWWSGGLRFTCKGCAKCCTGEPGVVTFTDEERAAMASHIGVSEDEFDAVYVWRRYGVRSLREKSGYDCVMLDSESGRCTIYDVRPAQCRTFPFWKETLKNKLNWDEYSRSCPGMNSGELHAADEIFEQLRLSSKKK